METIRLKSPVTKMFTAQSAVTVKVRKQSRVKRLFHGISALILKLRFISKLRSNG